MSFQRAKAWLDERGLGDRVVVPERSSATVEQAAAALGCEPAHIAKTMALMVDGRPVLVLAAGDARVSNSLFKKAFHTKARFIGASEVEELVGHAPGGVCPFGINDGIKVYLDESLRRFDFVYPACGDDHSGVRLSCGELEAAADATGWVDVCQGWRPEE